MAFTERSRAAREAILAAARRRFSEEGYDGTTVRMVAADAGVDPSMVIRYYGSKDRLFAAAVDFDLGLPDIAGVPPPERGRVLAEHFVRVWESDWGQQNLLILLRSAVSHAEATEGIHAVFTDQVLPLVRAASGDPDDAEVRAGLFSTQILGTALARYLLRLPPLAALDPETLAATLAPLLQHVLTGPLTAPATSG